MLSRAITSVLNQSYKAKEIIVVDDGSQDSTSEVVKTFDGVLLLRQTNLGVSAARNNGIMMADSEWIAFLDSDDEWHMDKLKEQVALLKKNPEAVFSYTDEIWIKDGQKINIPKKFTKLDGEIFKDSLDFCNIAPSSALIKSSIFKEIGTFDEELDVCEDYDLWLRILKKYPISLVKKPLINKYAGHEDQLSVKHWGMDRFRVRALEKLHTVYSSDKDIIETVLKKYELLLKGALNNEKYDDAEFYEGRLRYFKTF